MEKPFKRTGLHTLLIILLPLVHRLIFDSVRRKVFALYNDLNDDESKIKRQ